MTKEDLDKYFKDKYPHLLELYKFLFERRIKDINDKINYLTLLTSISLFFVFGIWNAIDKSNQLFWIPLFFLVISMFILLYGTIPRKFWFHWFEKDKYMEFYFQKKNFYEMGFRDIFGSIPHIDAYSKSRKRIYLISFYLLFFSFISMIVILTYVFTLEIILSLLVFLVSSIIVLIASLKIDKELIDSPTKRIEAFFDDWVNIEKNKKRNL